MSNRVDNRQRASHWLGVVRKRNVFTAALLLNGDRLYRVL